ncbi:thiamine diphosphokinase [Clostridium sp. Marseille-P2415]|uniref:thiamine diphosphokinase n=1 Tax=Clostridium sp. Marseille-P2415 TaxID=1805471 RepID=UPI0009884335|nr:thiamine diphosphokinase [Clostridium sp. Marseille-P2415]
MKKEITGLIVTGGTMNYGFAGRFLENRTFDKVIAVDGGLASLHKLHLKPDAIVGDFDTVDPEVLAEYKSCPDEITWEIHRPEKDETDTELALDTAIKLGCTKLILLGATGGRMDHFIGNIHLLYACLKKGVEAAIADEKNWITVLDRGRTFAAEEVKGKYISFLPLSGEVKGITLTGFKYPLHKKDIDIGTSLCISNELTGEKGTIDFDSGTLICVESHD